MDTQPACAFLKNDGTGTVRCDEVATALAFVPALDAWLPACADCAVGRQTRKPA